MRDYGVVTRYFHFANGYVVEVLQQPFPPAGDGSVAVHNILQPESLSGSTTAEAVAAAGINWEKQPDAVALAIPTYLDQVNPSMDRESPMHDIVFKRMDSLGAKLVYVAAPKVPCPLHAPPLLRTLLTRSDTVLHATTVAYAYNNAH